MTAQAMEALNGANRLRQERAQFARETFSLPHRTGKLMVANVLRDPNPALGSYRLEELLRFSVRHCGRAVAARLVAQADLPAERLRQRVRELPQRERERLALTLEGHPPPPLTAKTFAAVGL